MVARPLLTGRKAENARERAGQYQRALAELKRRHRKEFDHLYKLAKEGKI